MGREKTSIWGKVGVTKTGTTMVNVGSQTNQGGRVQKNKGGQGGGALGAIKGDKTSGGLGVVVVISSISKHDLALKGDRWPKQTKKAQKKAFFFGKAEKKTGVAWGAFYIGEGGESALCRQWELSTKQGRDSLP